MTAPSVLLTDDVVLDRHWSLIVPAGNEFLLTLPDDQAVRIRVAMLKASAFTGLVADLTALAAIVDPQDGDSYLLRSESIVYTWDATGGELGEGAWVAGDTLDDIITVTGHNLGINPRTGLVESLNRALVGPGHVCARTLRDSLAVTLTAWTPVI